MATISVSLPSDGTTADVSDYNTPITTIVNEVNGNLDNANIKTGAAIATSKLADDAGITTAKIAAGAVTSAKTDFTPQVSEVDTAEGTTSTSYTNLATTGPAVTITVPSSGKIWLSFGSLIANSVSGGSSYMALDISGANTVAAGATKYEVRMSAANNAYQTCAKSFLVTGLTPGSTTFTAKYKVSANTGTYSFRHISAFQVG